MLALQPIGAGARLLDTSRAYAATMSSRELSDGDVRALRERAGKGERDVVLAAEYDISVGAVVALRTHVRRAAAGGPRTSRRDRTAMQLTRERVLRAASSGILTHVQIAERVGTSRSVVEKLLSRTSQIEEMKKLRKEVARLRHEVSELRAAVRAEGA